VLVGLAHAEIAARQPEWREALGAATSVTVPRGGVAEVLPRIVTGIRSLGIEPSGERGEPHPAAPVFVPAQRRSAAARVLALPPWQRMALLVGLVAVVAVVVVVSRGGGGGTQTAAPGSSPTATSGTDAPAVDAGTTPLQTNIGEARLRSAVLTDEFCPPPGFPGACKHPSQNLYLVVTLEGWGGGSLTIWVTQDSNESYVLVDGHRYNPTSQADETSGVVRVVYGGVPASAAGRTATLSWPRNPPMTVHVTRG
jgi:hypothetical protein